MGNSIQALGLCRFSLPSIGAFQSQDGSIEDIRARLYQPERLNQRLAWFEHVTLPALRHQTDPDFTLVLLIGADLPEPWRGALCALTEDVPQIRIETAEPGPHRALCADAMRPHLRPEAEFVAQFRLDDDDAISTDFIARMRRDLQPVLGLLELRDQFAVDYGRGFVLRWTEEGLIAEPRYARQWTPGLVHVSRPALGRFILDIDHSKMWRHMTLLSWTDEYMWIRGAHGGNDSDVPGAGGERITLAPERIDRQLTSRFKIDQAAFARRLLDIAPETA